MKVRYEDSPKVPSSFDRRHYPRLPVSGLMANVGGRLLTVVDISATGLMLEKQLPLQGARRMDLTLYPVDQGRVELNSGIRVAGEVVHEAERSVGMRFLPASLALVKFVAGRLD